MGCRRWRRRLVLRGVGVGLVLAIGCGVAHAEGRCAGLPRLVGPCFTIRGRAALYNGNPTVRIWKVGTRRMLGVSDSRCRPPECRALPDAVQARLDWDRPVFADFLVCPFTHERSGVMQMVCVEAATRVRSH